MKICFWGNNSAALEGNTYGGGELQLALLAKALARGGNEVVIIDYETDKDFVTSDGIRVFKVEGWNNGIRFLRLFTHRLPKLYKLLKDQKADVYYCRMRDFRHIFAFRAARKVGGRFVLGLASNLDVMNFRNRLRYNHIVSKFGIWNLYSNLLIEMVQPSLLRNSDLILAQHEGQRSILAKKGIDSALFPNLFEFPKVSIGPVTGEKKEFVYVGRLDKRKGFGELFEIIKRSPQHYFKIIGAPFGKTGISYFEKLKSYPNVQLMGKLSHPNTILQISNSKAIISTSAMEGFPNIFIEAWASGVPVLSLFVDPGDIIKIEGLGSYAQGSIEKMLAAMDHVDNSPEFAFKAKKYVEETYLLTEKRIASINHLFESLKLTPAKKHLQIHTALF